MRIRDETRADAAAIRSVVAEAFRAMPFSRQTEHHIVDALRRQSALTISLIAEENGAIVGHIAFSPATINGGESGWFALGPLAVALAHQRRGIGSALARAGLDRLRAQSAAGCAVLGSVAYYSRFGFRRDSRLVCEGVPPEHFMVQAFAGEVPWGTAAFHPAFAATP